MQSHTAPHLSETQLPAYAADHPQARPDLVHLPQDQTLGQDPSRPCRDRPPELLRQPPPMCLARFW